MRLGINRFKLYRVRSHQPFGCGKFPLIKLPRLIHTGNLFDFMLALCIWGRSNDGILKKYPLKERHRWTIFHCFYAFFSHSFTFSKIWTSKYLGDIDTSDRWMFYDKQFQTESEEVWCRFILHKMASINLCVHILFLFVLHTPPIWDWCRSMCRHH